MLAVVLLVVAVLVADDVVVSRGRPRKPSGPGQSLEARLPRTAVRARELAKH